MKLEKIENKIICLVLISVLFVILNFAYLAIVHYVIKRYWPDTKLDKEYLQWRTYGGNYKEAYYDQLVMDVNRLKLIEALNEQEILKKIPNLNNGDFYGPNAYKGQNTDQSSSVSKKTKIYWLNKKDGFDWRITITDNKIELSLIKG